MCFLSLIFLHFLRVFAIFEGLEGQMALQTGLITQVANRLDPARILLRALAR